jgi:hypothetical protein
VIVPPAVPVAPVRVEVSWTDAPIAIVVTVAPAESLITVAIVEMAITLRGSHGLFAGLLFESPVYVALKL